MSKTGIKGFTLPELMVTIAVVVILAIIAVPSYRRWGESSAIKATTNELVATLHFARTQAVERDRKIRVCSSKDQSNCSGNWSDGWIVRLADSTGKLIQVHQRKSTRAQIHWNRNTKGVVFDPNGFSRGYNGSFSITGKSYPDKTCLVLAQTGRIRTTAGDKQKDCTDLELP